MFKVNELLRATAGKLVCGRADTAIGGISIDSRTIKPQEAFIAIKGNNFDGHNFIDEAIEKGARAVIIHSPLTTHHSPVKNSKTEGRVSFIEVQDTLKALGDIARCHRKKFNVPVIAVTGSNGKTTTKEMIASVLSARFKVLKNQGTKNNPIGLPMALLMLDDSYDIAILEIGTNRFGEVGYLSGICLPNIAIITNIGPSHLEFFNNLKGVLKEKYALLDGLKDPRIAILNADDSLLRKKIVRNLKRHTIFGIGIENKSDFLASDIKASNEKIDFSVNKKFKFTLNTSGYHNIYNALAAIGLARIVGLEYDVIAEALFSFSFPQGRLTIIELKNIKIIDDTYNSNPLSLRGALEVLANFKTRGKKIMVMGDMLELGLGAETFHRLVGNRVAQICDALITVGRLSRFAATAARQSGLDIKNIFSCASSLEARDILFNRILPGPDDVVLIKGSRSMKMEEVFKI